MGYSISHGGTKRGYSYLQISELGAEVKKAAGWREWRQIKTLFASRTDNYFEIPPRQAADMGAVLIDVAARLPHDSRQMAEQIGQSGLRAAAADETWVWR